MGSVFRCGFRCKTTGRRKRVKAYSLKYKDEHGRWVVEPTDIVRRPLAERLLMQREAEVASKRAGPAALTSADQATADSPRAGPPVALDLLRQRYLTAARLRLKESTCTLYQETLAFTLAELGAEGLGDLTPERVEDYAGRRVAQGASARTVNIQVGVLKR